MRSYSPTEIENMTIKELPLDGAWEYAFGRPAWNECWFIEGESASGKSTFVMMLAKKLTEYGRVNYVALEERVNLSFKRRAKRLQMSEVDSKFRAVLVDSFDELKARVGQHKSAHFWIIDSVQYIGVNSFAKLKRELLDAFPRKSFIFITQNFKGVPKGRMANDLKYHAGVKIRTEGFRAHCSGRYVDNVATYFTIWEEGAQAYYLNK